VTLYPLYHPAAALYTPTMLAVLERDVARLTELLAAAEGASDESPRNARAAPEVGDDIGAARVEGGRQPVQLGLF
jgi:DNA polymerase